MRIVTIGGGPAGLYASLLLAKAERGHEITVIERNAADATYGWGVVFSDRTLAEFREADVKTFERITDAFVKWEAITVRHREQLVRSGGHGFAGIARVHLLRILQERCRELGVELRFEQEAPRAAEVDADLVIAADGVRSETREAGREAFRPRLEDGNARYIWFGAPLPLDSFTFSFAETEHGLFQAHTYPYDDRMSTFVVECHEDVWRRAGLEHVDEARSIELCERVFAEELRGAPLRSNRSSWLSFVTVRCGRWSDGNVVLVGDAAHTAHFSIGAGTKLAMEDAIGLARAFEKHGDDVPAALDDYEAERRPPVERFQEAAEESRGYFEQTARYVHLPTPMFAFNLLTRSGRIHYDVLRVRDARYVDGVDRWFAGGGDAAPPPLFTPFDLGALRLPSRAVRRLDAGEAPRPGAALVMSGPAAVSAEGRITPGERGLYGDDDVVAWRAVAEAVQAIGARAGLRIGHAGRRAATRDRRGGLDRPLAEKPWPLLAASAIAYSSRAQTPKAMDRGDMDLVREELAAAAGRAAKAGFDVLELDMSHGYLLSGFLSPLANRREDAYGGALEARLRFPLEVLGAVREAWVGPLVVAINASDLQRGGLELEEGVEVARAVASGGADLVHVLAGFQTPRMRPRYGPAFLGPLADIIRNEARVPVLVGGAISNTGRANTLLAGGRADLVILD